MASYPKVESRCPLQNAQARATAFDGDFCRACDRRVHDLSAMNDAQRVAFMAQCSGEVCVSYTVSKHRSASKLAQGALAATLATMAASGALIATSAAADPLICDTEIEVIVGGIKSAEDAEWLELEPLAVDAPELPIVWDDSFESQSPAKPVTTPSLPGTLIAHARPLDN